MNNYAYETVRILTEKNMKIATAESCTGGMIAQMITDISGASRVFDCGIVSYSNCIKSSLLGVAEDTLKKHGAVSEETVREMVSGVLEVSGADIGIAVSGIAGPSSDDTDKPVGLIYIAVATNEKTFVKKLNNSFSVNIRENNRNSAANEALKLVCEVLENKAV